jgi:hypothetical protein
MKNHSEVLTRGGRVIGRGPVQDAALILLSPLWLLIAGVIVGFPPATIAGWVAGAIMLWLSRAWRVGEKLIGTLLSGVSFAYGGIFGVSVSTTDPDRVGAALALLWSVLLLQMVPATVGVIYLWKKLHARSTLATNGDRGRVSERPTVG